MKYSDIADSLPSTNKKVVAVLSGGLDSSVMTTMLAVRYGADKVVAVSYDYGQKQKEELTCASKLCKELGISHSILDLKILGDIALPMSANISGSDISMPTISDVLGDPQPPTYVPFRNMILISLTLSFAESNKASHVFTGLQVHDEYGYWDTSQRFVDSINAVASQNRTHKVEVLAPFSHLSKKDEIEIMMSMGLEDFLQYTLTCYNPEPGPVQCGMCPSCSERIAAFVKAGIKDPVPYGVNIVWSVCA